MRLRGIASVSEELDLQQYVLRYWETQFRYLRPMRRGRTRLYRDTDVELVAGIRDLLHRRGFTIAGAKQIFQEKGPSYVRQIGRGESVEPHLELADAGIASATLSDDELSALRSALADPVACRALAAHALSQRGIVA